MGTDEPDAISRYLADNADAPLTRDSLTIALTAVRSDLAVLRAQIRFAEDKARAAADLRPLEEIAEEYVEHAVTTCGGSVTAARKALHISAPSVYRYLAKLKRRREDGRSTDPAIVEAPG